MRKTNIGRYIIHKGDSTAIGQLGVVVAETDERYECRRIVDGQPLVCPDSRCSTGCVICTWNLRHKEVHFMTENEVKFFRDEQMIP